MLRSAALLFSVAWATTPGCSEKGSPSPPASGSAAPAATSVAALPSSVSAAPVASSAAPPAPIACNPGCLDVEKCEGGTCVPNCPAGSVYIPKTPAEGFTMGRGKVAFGFGARGDGNTGHGIADMPHKVILTKPFCMDAYEIRVSEYEKCVEAGKCTLPDTRTAWVVYPKKPDHPANMIDWTQAKAYCEFAGKSLPTEAQWEWAARGPDDRRFPWGDKSPTCELADFTPGDLPSPACDCGCHGGGASAVGAHPAGDKEWPTGKIHDLAGNVWEWCLDNYRAFDAKTATDPLYVTHEQAPHVVKGGGWNRSHAALETSYRGTAIVGYQRPALGGRCIRNARP